MYRIGIDLGGTKIEAILLEETCDTRKELMRKRIPTEQDKGYEHILNNIRDLYREIAMFIENKPHTLGIGTPGTISKKTGLLKNSNTLCLNQKPFRQDIESKLGRSVVVENDANCFALAEAKWGAGRGKELVFGIILGTGCGGGIIYKGEIIRGLQNIAGEWGHMAIDPNGPKCYCGSRGCVETFISGRGLERFYAREYKENLSLQQIVKRYREQEENAVAFMEVFFQDFGRAVANLINVLDPDIVVIGGGVSNIDEIYTEGVERVREKVFSDSLETPIVKNQLGDSAGVIGAALVGIGESS